MDEYIKRADAEEALAEYRMSLTMSKFADMETCIESRGIVEGAMNALCFVPTADVVPKSEYDAVVSAVDNSTKEFLKLHDEYQYAERKVERLKHILNCYALQYGTVVDQQSVIDKAKAEVAREIFEEIERALDNHHYANLLVGVITPISYYDAELEDAIAELKKKYTE